MKFLKEVQKSSRSIMTNLDPQSNRFFQTARKERREDFFIDWASINTLIEKEMLLQKTQPNDDAYNVDTQRSELEHISCKQSSAINRKRVD